MDISCYSDYLERYWWNDQNDHFSSSGAKSEAKSGLQLQCNDVLCKSVLVPLEPPRWTKKVSGSEPREWGNFLNRRHPAWSDSLERRRIPVIRVALRRRLATSWAVRGFASLPLLSSPVMVAEYGDGHESLTIRCLTKHREAIRACWTVGTLSANFESSVSSPWSVSSDFRFEWTSTGSKHHSKKFEPSDALRLSTTKGEMRNADWKGCQANYSWEWRSRGWYWMTINSQVPQQPK